MAVKDSAIPDFAGVECFEDIRLRFVSAARCILFQHKLVFGSRCVEISSLELYLKLHQQPHIWWDPVTDEGAQEQYNRATWYVRQKKGPAYWRIDITAGCRSLGIQAGLLIRAIDRHDGPANALHAMVRGNFGRHRWNDDERRRIQEIHGRSIFGQEESPLRLAPRKTPLEGPYYIGSRIGISERHDRINYEGISSREAPLRIATWRMDSRDEEHLE
jgi:hypothetical protein